MSELNIRKRGTSWEYRFEGAKINGKRKQITKGGYKTKKECVEYGTKALAEYNNSGLHFVPSELSLSDYLKYWITQYCEVNLLKTTCENYKKKIRLYIEPALGKYKIKSISSAVLQDFINQKFNEGLSRNTLSVIKGILVSSFSYATFTLNFIQSNPMASVKLPLCRAVPDVLPKTKERTYIPQDIINKIFNRFPETTTAYIPLMLGYTCGLRLGETFAIDLEKDIDYKNGYLFVNHQVQYLDGHWTLVPPKYGSYRKIKLDMRTLEKLTYAREKHFRSIDYYDKYYKQLLINDKDQLNYEEGTPVHILTTRECGEYIQPRIMQHVARVIHYDLNYMKFDYHSLRHTHTAMLLEAGANIKDIQERLGHKNIETTLQVYSHTTEKMQSDTTVILDKLLTNLVHQTE